MRTCFTLRVRPDRLDEYRRGTATSGPRCWPPCARRAGTTTPSSSPTTACSIGYLECDDFDAALAAMARTEVNARWQAEMAEFFVDLDGAGPTNACGRSTRSSTSTDAFGE